MSQLRSCASHRETGLNRISGYHGLNVIYCRFLSFSKLQGYREVCNPVIKSSRHVNSLSV